MRPRVPNNGNRRCPSPSTSTKSNPGGLKRGLGELGVDPRELAKAAVNDLLARPAEDFDRAARLVLDKNRGLCRRLR